MYLTVQLKNTDHPVTMQCSTGKSWVLAFMWMPPDTHHQPKH